MARRRRPEDWPGVPHDAEKPSGVYAPLDSDGARWIGAAGAWSDDNITDKRQLKSAHTLIPTIWQHKRRDEVTRDGRPFVSETVEQLSSASGMGVRATSGALRKLSSGSGLTSPLSRLTAGRKGSPACYRLNAPREFLASDIDSETESCERDHEDSPTQVLEIRQGNDRMDSPTQVPELREGNGSIENSDSLPYLSDSPTQVPELQHTPLVTISKDTTPNTTLLPTTTHTSDHDPEPTLTCSEGGPEDSEWIPDDFGWGGL